GPPAALSNSYAPCESANGSQLTDRALFRKSPAGPTTRFSFAARGEDKTLSYALRATFCKPPAICLVTHGVEAVLRLFALHRMSFGRGFVELFGAVFLSADGRGKRPRIGDTWLVCQFTFNAENPTYAMLVSAAVL